MNSHIQLSQLLMRGFKEKILDNESVRILDLKEKCIRIKKIKEIDVTVDYFEEGVEKYLADIESKFGQVILKFKNFEKKKQNIVITKEDINIINIFIEYLILRNERMAKVAIESSYTLGLFGNNPSGVIRWYLYDENNRILRDYWPNIVVNKTEIDFVLPRNGLYSARQKGEEIYILPINKRVGIVMMPKKLYDEHKIEGGLEYGIIDDVKIVKLLNDYAYYTEKNIGNKFLIGSEDELMRIMNLNNGEI